MRNEKYKSQNTQYKKYIDFKYVILLLNYSIWIAFKYTQYGINNIKFLFVVKHFSHNKSSDVVSRSTDWKYEISQ